MLLQLIESTYYFMESIYKDFLLFYYNEKEGRGKATKAMIRSKELGTY